MHGICSLVLTLNPRCGAHFDDANRLFFRLCEIIYHPSQSSDWSLRVCLAHRSSLWSCVDCRLCNEYQVIAEKGESTPTTTEMIVELREFMDKAEKTTLVEMSQHVLKAKERMFFLVGDWVREQGRNRELYLSAPLSSLLPLLPSLSLLSSLLYVWIHHSFFLRCFFFLDTRYLHKLTRVPTFPPTRVLSSISLPRTHPVLFHILFSFSTTLQVEYTSMSHADQNLTRELFRWHQRMDRVIEDHKNIMEEAVASAQEQLRVRPEITV